MRPVRLFFLVLTVLILVLAFAREARSQSKEGPSLVLHIEDGKVSLEAKNMDLSGNQISALAEKLKEKVDDSPLRHGGTLNITIRDKEANELAKILARIDWEDEDALEEIWDDFDPFDGSDWGEGTKRVLFGQDFRVEKDEAVDQLIAIGSNGVIAGRVGKLVALGSRIHLTSTAQVVDKMVAVGSDIQRDEGAEVSAQEATVLLPTDAAFWSSVGSGFRGVCAWWPWRFIGGLWTLLMALALGALYIYLAPEFNVKVVEFLRERTIASFGIGLLGHFLVPPIVVLLFITILGIPLVPLFLVLCLLVAMLGHFSLASLIGGSIPRRGRFTGVKALVIGLVILGLVQLIPFVGLVFVYLAAMAGIGAVIRTLLCSCKRCKGEAKSVDAAG